jgi:mRNA-degrading endonuclease HigB of HigAB toxin-antitoxin module
MLSSNREAGARTSEPDFASWVKLLNPAMERAKNAGFSFPKLDSRSLIWEYPVTTVYGHAVILKFAKKHAASQKPLSRFPAVARKAEWPHFAAVRQSFPAADYAPATGMLIFDIEGNQYRRIRAEHGDGRKTQLTADEQRTLMTLWTIARQPLMFGGDLPSSDEATLALIANDEVLAADQKGSGSRKLFERTR